MKQTVLIASDHAGYPLKQKLIPLLRKARIPFEDLSPVYKEGDDFPKIAKPIAKRIAKSSEFRGILICGSGIGMAMASNRIKGVRAMVGHEIKEVEKARNDDAVNVLTLNGRRMRATKAIKLIKTFLKTPASTAGRFKRRVKQLDE